MRYVIAYDVVDDRKRTRLAEVLLDYGERVQKSVFEADLKRSEVQEIVQRVSHLIAPEDSLRFYPMCETCARGILTSGQKTQELHPSYRIV